MHTWKDLPRTVLAALGGVAAYLFGPWDALLVALLAAAVVALGVVVVGKKDILVSNLETGGV